MEITILFEALRAIIAHASFLSVIIVLATQIIKWGLRKIGLSKLKTKHENLYKFILTMLSLAMIAGGVFIDVFYVLELPIIFATELAGFWFSIGLLSVPTVALVFLSYNGIYEGMGIKALLKSLWNKLKELANQSEGSPFAKFINLLSSEKIEKAIDEIKDTKEEIKKEVNKVKEEAKGTLKIN